MLSQKLQKDLMNAYAAVHEEKRGHAAGDSDVEKQASQLASDVRYKAKGKIKPGASDEEKKKVMIQILGASPAPNAVKAMAKSKLLGEKVEVREGMGDELIKKPSNLKDSLGKLKKEIFRKSGEEFNLNSPKQLGEILFDKLKLVSKPKKTKTGQYSTSEEVLSSLANDHKIIQDILEWRSLDKLQNTYVKSLPNEVSSLTNRVHSSFNQTVTTTGRLSSNNPNLQNIPIRTANGQKIRRAFIPRGSDYILMAADYSQIELRVIASMSNEKNMIDAFVNNQDIHTMTASKIYNVDPENVTREQRGNAKTVNFGIIYGVSAFGLSQQTDLNRSESKVMIDNYFLNYPGLKKYMSDQIDFARNNGYVETIMGRRRYLQNINSQNNMLRSSSERNAINAPIQGSAADIIKIAMININSELKKQSLKSKMLLQVHDELVFDVHKSEKDQIKDIVKTTMESAVKLKVPLKIDLEFGKNWLEAH